MFILIRKNRKTVTIGCGMFIVTTIRIHKRINYFHALVFTGLMIVILIIRIYHFNRIRIINTSRIFYLRILLEPAMVGAMNY